MATLNPNLRDFWQDPETGKLLRARNRVLYGGRSSSKSWEFAGRVAHISSQYTTRVLCVRRFQNKIKESVYTLIRDQIKNFNLPGFDIQAANIYHQNGSEFSFYGIERNVDEIKSFEGADILWLEESHNLTEEQWNILEPTIRKAGSEIWLSFNPRLVTDFVWQKFIVNTPPNTIVRKVNYDDNPFLSDTMLEIINHVKETDPETHEHIYLGEPLMDEDGAIIRRSWCMAAVDAHKKLGIDMSGAQTVGYDIADSGPDKNALSEFNGSICERLEEWKADPDSLTKSARRAWSWVTSANGRLIYDGIGNGAHVGSTLLDMDVSSEQFTKFMASGALHDPDEEYMPNITNKEKFENLKAQAWRDVADRLRNTYNAVTNGHQFKPSEMISISSDIDNLEGLIDELSIQKWGYSKRGLDMVETKLELKKRLVASPNKADAFVMGACPHLVENELDFLSMGC